MPFYRFHVDTPEPQPVVVERLKAIVRDTPGFWESFNMGWRRPDPRLPPFVGTVQGNLFKMRRDIRYRNSFLPIIRAHAEPAGVVTRVTVNMFIHPFVAVFVVLWSAVMGSAISRAQPTWAWYFVAFTLAVVVTAFVPEARKAKRLITDALHGQSTNGVYMPTKPIA
jgi:hypothetical protein